MQLSIPPTILAFEHIKLVVVFVPLQLLILLFVPAPINELQPDAVFLKPAIIPEFSPEITQFPLTPILLLLPAPIKFWDDATLAEQ